MKPYTLLLALAAAVASAALPGTPLARAAEIKILQPLDKSLVRGVVDFRVRPHDLPTEQFFSNPEFVVENELGDEVTRFPTVRDRKTGICSAAVDTRELRDGLYLVSVRYRTLMRGKDPADYEEDFTIGVRNGRQLPGRFEVEVPAEEQSLDDSANVVVRVFDKAGRRMPAARVALKVDRGSVNSDAEITGAEGEISTSVDSEEAGPVTVTVTVENLPPVTRVVRFVKK